MNICISQKIIQSSLHHQKNLKNDKFTLISFSHIFIFNKLFIINDLVGPTSATLMLRQLNMMKLFGFR